MGRVWCGWACPQTVFTDSIYRVIERFVEGKARKRKALDRAPWNLEKIWKRGLKWFLYIVVTLHITHSFLGYFVGTHKLFWITMQAPSENWTLFMTMLIISGILLFDFGWFKEQFCIIACPYGRFQSVVMDDNSMVVAYDEKRGEPRRAKGLPKEDEGDCIDCFHCVKACPTGIDIRRGVQLECIACTMCIDACDNIMRKIKKPEGLIRYTTENELKGVPKKFQLRSVVYLAVLGLMALGLAFSLNKRLELKTKLMRAGSSPYQVIKLAGGKESIVNHYKLKLYYNKDNKTPLQLELKDKNQRVELTLPFEEIEFDGDQFVSPVFFKFPPTILTSGKKIIYLEIKEEGLKEPLATIEVKLVGPTR